MPSFDFVRWRALSSFAITCLLLSSGAAIGATALTPASATSQQKVAATASQRHAATVDTFSRSLSAGWGSADRGGVWSTVGQASRYTVEGGAGRMSVRAGQALRATLAEAASDDIDLRVRFSTDKALTGGGEYLSFIGRKVDSLDYRTRVRLLADGTVLLQLVQGARMLQSVTVPDVTHAAGTSLNLRMQVTGTSPTTIQAKLWPASAAEPGTWQASVTSSTAGLQTAGNIAFESYLSRSATSPVTTRFDDLTVVPTSDATTPNAAPAAPAGAPTPAATPKSSAPEATAPTPTQPKPAAAKPAAAKPAAVKPAAETKSGSAGASSTGVPKGTKLSVHQGDLTVKTPGAVIDSLDIRGFVRVEAPGVTIKNSIIRGRATSGNATLLYAGTGTSSGLRVIDSEIAPTHKSSRTNGVYGYGFTLTRVDIHDVIDAVHIFGDNVTVENSALRDNLHYANDPAHGGGPSHDDSIQIQQGRNIRIVGNTISGAHNAAIQITQDRGTVANVTIAKNEISGGGCTINVAEKKKGAISGLTISDNTFGDSRFTCNMLVPPTTKLAATANTVLDGVLTLNRRAQ